MTLLRRISSRLMGTLARPFSTASYWERRYATGGTSGDGSVGALAAFKADVINGFIEEHGVRSVIEFGCGDGRQLSLLRCPRYIGLDVSRTAIRLCADRFRGDAAKSFFVYDPPGFHDHAGVLRSDLALSLDVIYHLMEDDLYDEYLEHLFGSASRFVIIYAVDADAAGERLAPHNRPRPFTRDIGTRFPLWKVLRRIPNPYPYDSSTGSGSWSDFTIFRSSDGSDGTA